MSPGNLIRRIQRDLTDRERRTVIYYEKDELKERIKSLISEVTFTYNGERCGVDPFSAHDLMCGMEINTKK